MREVPLYRTFDGREWENYRDAADHSNTEFFDKYGNIPLGQVKHLIEDDEILKEYVTDILYEGPKATTRYKIETIPSDLFETVDGRRFDGNEEALAHENALVDEAINESSAFDLVRGLAGTSPHLYSQIRGAIAKGVEETIIAKAKVAALCDPIQSN